MNNDSSIILLDHLSKKVNGNPAVCDLSASWDVKRKIAIVGETGSGKSTLLKMIAGLEQPDSGAVYFQQKRVIGPHEQLIPGHPDIAYLSQFFELRNNYKVKEVLTYENYMEEDKCQDIYRICDILHLVERWTDELSGGEKQRVALAKLLTNSPSLLLLDEPFAHLDRFHKNRMKELTESISVKLGMGCIMVSHDAQDVLSWADELHILDKGKIIQSGTPVDVYHYPVNEKVAGLLGDYQLIKAAHPLFDYCPSPSLNKEECILLRPGYFECANKEEGFAVVVEKNEFMGDTTRLTLRLAKSLFPMQSTSFNVDCGDIIHIRYNRSHFHVIK